MTVPPAPNHARPLLLAALLSPVLIHFALLWLYAVNAPRLDDFPEVLMFLPDWHATSSWQDKLALLFRDYQNHRYVLYHCLLLLFGGIDFRVATLIGNLPLLMLCWLMYRAADNHPRQSLLAIIGCWLVFNLQTWRGMLWGPIGTTNLLYPMLALLACWLATRPSPRLWSACGIALLLTLSHGSGPLLFPVITAWLYLQHGRSVITTSWILLTAAVWLLFYVVFPLTNEAGYASMNLAELIQYAWHHIIDGISGLMAILGSHLLYNDQQQPWKHQLAILLGSAEVLLMAWLIWQGSLRRYPALLLWLGFLLVTAGSIAVGRVAPSGDIEQALQGHYKLINGLWLWLLAVAGLQWLQDHRPSLLQPATSVTLSASILLFCAALLLFLKPMQTLQQQLVNDIAQWPQTHKLQQIETRLFVKQPNLKLKAALEGGFYTPYD